MDAKRRREALTRQIRSLPQVPGIYQMLDATSKVLYVGKAKRLRQRVLQYLDIKPHAIKTQRMMEKVCWVEVVVTQTEREALLLEYTLIQQLKPRYNVVFRDDKSYLYIHLTDEPFPRLYACRKRRLSVGQKGCYFGPYTQAHQVKTTLNLLYRIFRLRQCDIGMFRGRTRPCLQHQIKRCTAPCVGLIDREDYQKSVRYVKWFLSGKQDHVIQQLVAEMAAASSLLNYEQASLLRDQIRDLREIQAQPTIMTQTKQAVDLIGVKQSASFAVIHVMTIREGCLRAGRETRIKLPLQQSMSALLAHFLPQHYLNSSEAVDDVLPALIIVPERHASLDWVLQALEAHWEQRVCIRLAKTETEQQWLATAEVNAALALDAYLGRQGNEDFLKALPDLFLKVASALDASDALHVQCWDISHTQGAEAVAAGIMFNREGRCPSLYRSFYIAGITPGDDYAAIAEALKRYYVASKKKPFVPAMVIIDGGKGQLKAAHRVLGSILPEIILISVAKDIDRKWGHETVWIQCGDHACVLELDHAMRTLLLRIRDEAHRFALQQHRKRRGKKQLQSSLEEISGIGPKRRQQLLMHFGGLQGLLQANRAQLKRVPSINAALVERILAWIKADG